MMKPKKELDNLTDYNRSNLANWQGLQPLEIVEHLLEEWLITWPINN